MAFAGDDSSSMVMSLIRCLPFLRLKTAVATWMPSLMPAPTRASDPVSGTSTPTRNSSARASPIDAPMQTKTSAISARPINFGFMYSSCFMLCRHVAARVPGCAMRCAAYCVLGTLAEARLSHSFGRALLCRSPRLRHLLEHALEYLAVGRERQRCHDQDLRGA